ncbi:Y26D4A.11 protein [Aphelenchoides avenae]|nr:Y26D4A.11 protein [Aphelenchus avenae]
MKEYFAKKEIDKRESYNPETKASYAERAIRSVKGRLYRYFSERHTLNWVAALPALLEGINASVCRVTGMAPNEVTRDNWEEVWNRLYADRVKTGNVKEGPFKSGDWVRIAKQKEAFEKGYLPLWSDEIFKVKRRIPTKPVTYEVRDRKDELMRGRFYAQHLSKTKSPAETTHRIAKVHRTRINDGKKELLVSFVGHDPYLRSWISEDQLV